MFACRGQREQDPQKHLTVTVNYDKIFYWIRFVITSRCYCSLYLEKERATVDDIFLMDIHCEIVWFDIKPMPLKSYFPCTPGMGLGTLEDANNFNV